MAKNTLLSVENITVAYGEMIAVSDVSFSVREGELFTLLGANGAGKTTILCTISGLLKPVKGRIVVDGKVISEMSPHDIVRMGIAHVPEGRRLFSRLTVKENLLLGAYSRKDRSYLERQLSMIYDLFPVLKERTNQRAGTLSGGEQQMVAISRGLMLNPRIMMLDEPSLGIAPALVDRIFDVIRVLKAETHMTILLVEQNVVESLQVSDFCSVLQSGQLVASGTPQELEQSDHIRKAYLGL